MIHSKFSNWFDTSKLRFDGSLQCHRDWRRCDWQTPHREVFQLKSRKLSSYRTLYIMRLYDLVYLYLEDEESSGCKLHSRWIFDFNWWITNLRRVLSQASSCCLISAILSWFKASEISHNKNQVLLYKLSALRKHVYPIARNGDQSELTTQPRCLWRHSSD